MIEIAIAAAEHIRRVWEIGRLSISPPWTYEAFAAELDRSDAYFAAALRVLEGYGAEPVGYVILRNIGGEGELLQIAVAPQSRNSGTGSSLMSSALGWARERGIKSVFLEVRERNEAARVLYARHGFKQVGLRKDYYSEPDDNAVIMEKTL